MAARVNKRVRARTPAKRKGASGAGGRHARIQAGEFKAVCLSLMERVRETGEVYVITKRGRPVAKIGPVTEGDVRPFIGRSRGVIATTREDLMAALGEDWEVDADL